MTTVKYDNTEIIGTTYNPRFVKHETAPERIFNLGELSREDGSVLISERYGMKSIVLQGIIIGTSVADLESKIDAFKELFSRVSKNLDIDWNGGTLRYVANCKTHTFDRDYFNLSFVPWTAEFVVVSGIGEDSSETALANSTFSTQTKTGAWTFGGSAEPKPRIRVAAHTFAATDPKGIQIKNTDNGERIVMTRPSGMGADEYFEVDCRLKTTKYNSVADHFYGVFPRFIVGANNFEITVGEILDQEFNSNMGGNWSYDIYDVNLKAQSFMVPNSDDTYQAIQLYLKKTGTPPNNLVVEVRSDLNGYPNMGAGGLITTFTFAPGDVSTGGWVRKTVASAFSLTANTRYWLVASMTAGDAANCYSWLFAYGASATYTRGNMFISLDGGSSWGEGAFGLGDLNFRLYYGGIKDTGKTYIYYTDYYKRYL